MRTWTVADYDDLSWHDDSIYGIAFRVGDPETGDWTSDLDLDIDHIVEWTCDPDGRCRFLVAPASLVFHGVTDPRIAIDWGSSGFSVSQPPPSIDRIERAPVEDQKVFLDRPYYRWRVLLNAPAGGSIELGAVGFTMSLGAEPEPCDEQQLPRRPGGRR